MPKFIYQGKYFQYVTIMFVSLLVMILIKYDLTYYLMDAEVWPEISKDNDLSIDYIILTMLGELYVISFATAIKITVDRLRQNSKLHEMEKRQLTTELKFLRSQVSPHFFFNTLNNIYSLTLEKSDKAPLVILKLSEFMRYLLYSSNQPRQDLKDELGSIRNYIDLERIRFNESLHIDFDITGELENKKIAPMLLIPLVENCFKHGANKNIGNTDIYINARIIDDFLYFDVSNTTPANATKSVTLLDDNGIGLSNVKKRLELGYAKEDYTLDFFERDHKFHVNLKLKVYGA